MITAAALLLFTLLCLAFGFDRAWSNVTLPERNELVFAERHRSYGAYRLRREYDQRLIIAFIGTVGLLALAAILPKVIVRMDPPVVMDPPVINGIDIDLEHPLSLPLEKPQAQKEKGTTTPPVKHSEETHLVVAGDSASKPPIPLADTSEIVGIMPPLGGMERGGLGTGPANTSTGGDGLGVDTGTKESFQVDVLPKFPGGEPALARWIQDHLIVPEGISGKDEVYVQFTVGVDGMVTDTRALKGKQALFKDAATRTVAHMPRWKPAQMNGQEVPCRLTLPIRFEVR